MKKMFALLLAVGAITSASAQEYARVLSSTPIVQQVAVPRQVCGNETIYNGQRSTSGGGAVLGAVAGGVVGNAIGRGSGRAAATTLGVLGGAILGNQIEGQGRPEYENVQRCTTETYYENRTVGYTVVYEYAGRQYTTQTPNDPGGWLAVNVQPYNDSRRPAYAPPSGAIYEQQPNGVTTYPVQPVYTPQPGVIIEYNNPPPYERPHHHRPHWR